jgi:hypothetical protein
VIVPSLLVSSRGIPIVRFIVGGPVAFSREGSRPNYRLSLVLRDMSECIQSLFPSRVWLNANRIVEAKHVSRIVVDEF